jgi:hypothetical protein
VCELCRREQREELRQCFDIIDADGSGSLTQAELEAAFACMEMNSDRAQQAMSAIDADGSGEVRPLFPPRIMLSLVDASITSLASILGLLEQAAFKNPGLGFRFPAA